MLWKMVPRLALLLHEGPLTALLAAMQGGFERLPGNMANAISKAFKSAKAELEISYTRKLNSREKYIATLGPETWLIAFPRLLSWLKPTYRDFP